MAATVRILEYYEATGPAPSTGTFILKTADLDPEQLDQIQANVLRMLAEG